MKWRIPAKTFLLGEYAALADLGAIILTTAPCFELTLTDIPGLDGIHPESPAGRWWHQAGDKQHGLHWYDPLNHCGGMGASSAQFVGAYLATAFLRHSPPIHQEMLAAYWQCAWQGQGLRPSGYDVLAQSLSCSQVSDELPACISMHRIDNRLESYPWPFRDLAFIIAHTGHKLATHHHLFDTTLPEDVARLDALVTTAHRALIKADSRVLVDAVNDYHQALLSMNRVSEYTQQLISNLQGQPGLLAIKGCGAMGADVLICLTTIEDVSVIQNRLREMNLQVLSSSWLATAL